MLDFQIIPLSSNFQEWVVNLLEEHWGSVKIVTRGKIYDADKLPGFIALKENKPVGLITYKVNEKECEIISLNSLIEGIGIGTALIEKVRTEALKKDCKRLLTITTNDNEKAIEYYKKRGFKIAKIHKNALDISRKLKPEIPLTGIDGIPLEDEVELEVIL